MLNFLEENAGNKPTLSVHRKCRSRSPVIKPKLEPAAGLQGAFSALSASLAVWLPGGKIGDLSLLSGRVWDIIEQQAHLSRAGQVRPRTHHCLKAVRRCGLRDIYDW